MFPNFTYFVHYFTGIPPDGFLSFVKTYGTCLAMGLFLGSILFKNELKRKEKQGLFGDYTVYEGQEYKGKFTRNFLNGFVLSAVFVGVIGSKVITIFDYIPEFFLNPMQVLKISGISAYGGLIFGYIAAHVYFRKSEIPFLPALDAISPTVLFTYSIARVGCQLSGDGDWGIIAAPKPDWWFLPNWMWSYDFPNNVLNKGTLIENCSFKYNHVLEAEVYPTSFYETVMTFTLFLILWNIRKKAFNPGFIFGICMIFNGIERVLIEIIRVNKKHNIAGLRLSQAQIIALFLIAAGIALCLLVSFKKVKNNPLQN